MECMFITCVYTIVYESLTFDPFMCVLLYWQSNTQRELSHKEMMEGYPRFKTNIDHLGIDEDDKDKLMVGHSVFTILVQT